MIRVFRRLQRIPERREKGVNAPDADKIAIASQWQLIKWKFLKNKLAVIGLVILTLFYISVIFADFISPYDPLAYNKYKKYHPPHKIHFMDEDGRFHIRPFVYNYINNRDPKTLLNVYSPDKSKKYRLKLFTRGAPYEMWGIIPADIHLFGVEDGGTFYLFGTDQLGRDMFSRIVFGGRISLSIGLVGIFVSFFLGVLLGGLSGYLGGAVDLIIQRMIEFIQSIPQLPLWMILSVALPPEWPLIKVYFGITIILSLMGWTGLARVVRGKFMALREEDFVMMARLYGAGNFRIIFVHLLPSFLSHIIASLTISIPAMILGETSLSFIGLGLQAPAISWGVLLKQAQSLSILATATWILIPGIFVIVTILCFNFVGDGLRDAADPYSNV